MKHVWLESADAAREIVRADSAKFTTVYATKSGVLKFWKGLGDIEFLMNWSELMEIVWHKSNGENVYRVAIRRGVIGS